MTGSGSAADGRNLVANDCTGAWAKLSGGSKYLQHCLALPGTCSCSSGWPIAAQHVKLW